MDAAVAAGGAAADAAVAVGVFPEGEAETFLAEVMAAVGTFPVEAVATVSRGEGRVRPSALGAVLVAATSIGRVVAEILLDQAEEDATLFPPHIFQAARCPDRQRGRCPVAVVCRRADLNDPPPALVHPPAAVRPSYRPAIGLLPNPAGPERVPHNYPPPEPNHRVARLGLGHRAEKQGPNLHNFLEEVTGIFSAPPRERAQG